MDHAQRIKATPVPEYRGNVHRSLADLDLWTRGHHEPAIEPDLPIIDAHHHLCDDKRGRYLLGEFLEDAGSGHNIEATVFVETSAMYRRDGPMAMRPVGEVEFANSVAAMSASGRFGKTRICAGIVGHADLMLGDHVRPVLEAMMEAGGGRFRGIRYGTTWEVDGARFEGKRQRPRHHILDPVFRRGFACLEALGLSFDAWLFFPQLPELAELLRAYPTANVVLNHAGGMLGIPPHDGRRNEVFAVWRKHLCELAQFPNLSVKVGGFGMLHCGWDFHLHDIPPSSEELGAAWRPYVEACVETFGTDRCMMESNFPKDKQSCGYGVLWNALKRITQGYSTAEKSALYRGTAARVYRI